MSYHGSHSMPALVGLAVLAAAQLPIGNILQKKPEPVPMESAPMIYVMRDSDGASSLGAITAIRFVYEDSGATPVEAVSLNDQSESMFRLVLATRPQTMGQTSIHNEWPPARVMLLVTGLGLAALARRIRPR